GRRGARLDRRTRGGARDPDGNPEGGRRSDHHVFRAPDGAVVAKMSTSTFIAACRRQPVPYTPIWVMRQAGRYLPEYRELRSRVDFEALTHKAELAAEVTIQPLRRFELDAAILFSDIMTPVQGMGVDLFFDPGPVVRNPIRTDAQIDALPQLVPERDVP